MMKRDKMRKGKPRKIHMPPQVEQWLRRAFVVDHDGLIPKTVLYESYESFCHSIKIRPRPPNTFGKLLVLVHPHIRTRRMGPHSRQVAYYAGISPQVHEAKDMFDSSEEEILSSAPSSPIESSKSASDSSLPSSPFSSPPSSPHTSVPSSPLSCSASSPATFNNTTTVTTAEFRVTAAMPRPPAIPTLSASTQPLQQRQPKTVTSYQAPQPLAYPQTISYCPQLLPVAPCFIPPTFPSTPMLSESWTEEPRASFDYKPKSEGINVDAELQSWLTAIAAEGNDWDLSYAYQQQQQPQQQYQPHQPQQQYQQQQHQSFYNECLRKKQEEEEWQNWLSLDVDGSQQFFSNSQRFDGMDMPPVVSNLSF